MKANCRIGVFYFGLFVTAHNNTVRNFVSQDCERVSRATITCHQHTVLCASFKMAAVGILKQLLRVILGQNQQNRDKEDTFVMKTTFIDTLQTICLQCQFIIFIYYYYCCFFIYLFIYLFIVIPGKNRIKNSFILYFFP